MENNLVVILPEEVKQLAERVSAEKQQEVNTVLNQVFANTAEWEAQVDAIEVKGITDRVSMQMADVARVNAKKARLNAEKIFDAKREEVQHRMASDKTEDSLWLKAKQITQIKLKAIEEKAEWKANFVKRYETEQRALIAQIRFEKAVKFSTEITLDQVASMTDSMFDMVLAGLEKTFNDKIESESKAEAERIAKIEAERIEQERIRAENERLKKEAIENANKEKLWRNRLAQLTDCIWDGQDAIDPKTNLQIISYDDLVGLSDQFFNNIKYMWCKEVEERKIKEIEIKEANEKRIEKERKEAEIKAQKEKEANDLILANERKIAADKIKAEQETARIATEKANAEKKAAELKAAEWKAKVDVQIKASNDKIEKEKAEQKAKEEQERQNAMASDKVKLTKWVNSIVLPEIILLGLDENSIATINVITSKFEGFKKWADSQIAAIK